MLSIPSDREAGFIGVLQCIVDITACPITADSGLSDAVYLCLTQNHCVLKARTMDEWKAPYKHLYWTKWKKKFSSVEETCPCAIIVKVHFIFIFIFFFAPEIHALNYLNT